jgi:hypothetical protein
MPAMNSDLINNRCTFIAQPSQAAWKLDATLGLNGCQRWLNDVRVSKLGKESPACRPLLRTT